MNETPKTTTAYKTISEVAKELNLINKKNGSLQTHTLRFWEKQFKQIKPLIMAGRRRYYSQKNFKTIKLVKHLLKDQGLTIKGVKKILDNNKEDPLDDSILLGVNNQNLKNSKFVKNKINKISRIIKEIKSLNNG
jgi:DNA-binding transcriptional MerR regulator